MPKKAYTGVGGVAKKLKTIYIGVNNKAKVVKKAYMGVDGKAKVWWDPDGPKTLYLTHTVNFESPDARGVLQTEEQESDTTPRILLGKTEVSVMSRDYSSVTPIYQTDTTYNTVAQAGTKTGYSDRMLVSQSSQNDWAVVTNDIKLHTLPALSNSFGAGKTVPLFTSDNPKVGFFGYICGAVDLSSYIVTYETGPSTRQIYSGVTSGDLTYVSRYDEAKIHIRHSEGVWTEMSTEPIPPSCLAETRGKVFYTGYPPNDYSVDNLAIIEPKLGTTRILHPPRTGVPTLLLRPKLKKQEDSSGGELYFAHEHSSTNSLAIVLNVETLTFIQEPVKNSTELISNGIGTLNGLVANGIVNADYYRKAIYHYTYRD